MKEHAYRNYLVIVFIMLISCNSGNTIEHQTAIDSLSADSSFFEYGPFMLKHSDSVFSARDIRLKVVNDSTIQNKDEALWDSLILIMWRQNSRIMNKKVNEDSLVNLLNMSKEKLNNIMKGIVKDSVEAKTDSINVDSLSFSQSSRELIKKLEELKSLMADSMRD
ncbi:MAG: hypothetical protein OEW75_11495 [Cyclobacteriaceae bacterium]|nr:hypothetical protein [Cyclobacteriaceae bacterium]